MGKNYKKYYKKEIEKNEEVVEKNVDNLTDEISGELIEEHKEMEENEHDSIIEIKGKVNCGKLNVRYSPDKESDVKCVIEKNTEVIIDPNYSTDDWYSVELKNGADGFCMKQFINILD